ncbi:MAG: GNAT family N-acetyltransferase [Ectothiorhodospiraceae bacterium]|jgi:GNAT superfamily N-acetyltransferase
MSDESRPHTDTPAPGHFLSVVTHLEMTRPPVGEPPSPPTPGVSLELWESPDLEAYLALFHRVGDPWLWHGRLEDDTGTILRKIQADTTRIWRLFSNGRVAGFCETDFSVAGEVEVVYCGLAPGHAGSGLGGYLLRSVLWKVWRDGVRRVWLHTCSEDHPGAIDFYRHLGFEPFDRTKEWIHDPRLRGLLPRDAAPHVPLPE